MKPTVMKTRRAAAARADRFGLGAGALRRTRSGLTILEMLMALALMAVLLIAVTAAMQAVFIGYGENCKIAEVTHTARVVLHRMMKEVRTAEAVTSTSASISIIPPDNAEGLEALEYELLGGTLYYHRTVNGTETSTQLIASGEDVVVTRFEISRQTELDGDLVEYTKTLTAKLGLKVGANPFDVTASVCPRRNLSL